jgi:hypothetical protein
MEHNSRRRKKSCRLISPLSQWSLTHSHQEAGSSFPTLYHKLELNSRFYFYFCTPTCPLRFFTQFSRILSQPLSQPLSRTLSQSSTLRRTLIRRTLAHFHAHNLHAHTLRQAHSKSTISWRTPPSRSHVHTLTCTLSRAHSHTRSHTFSRTLSYAL